MKRRVLFLTLVFVGLCTPAFARQNFIDRFLAVINRSRFECCTTGPLTQDRLPALIRNGEIPLSVERSDQSDPGEQPRHQRESA